MQDNKSLRRTRCEVFTRCVGYLRPISQFNEGKLQEFYERKLFVINKK